VSLPFGLSSAPWAFTKSLRPAIAHLRCLGIRLVVYLDDILIVHSSEAGERKDACIVRRLLESLGFIINEEKSIEIPAQTMEYIDINQGQWASESTFAKFYRRERTKEKRIEIEALLQVSEDDSD
jgi:hypothetical protein